MSLRGVLIFIAGFSGLLSMKRCGSASLTRKSCSKMQRADSHGSMRAPPAGRSDFPFGQLPFELLLGIVAEVDPDCLWELLLTSKHFYAVLDDTKTLQWMLGTMSQQPLDTAPPAKLEALGVFCASRIASSGSLEPQQRLSLLARTITCCPCTRVLMVCGPVLLSLHTADQVAFEGALFAARTEQAQGDEFGKEPLLAPHTPMLISGSVRMCSIFVPLLLAGSFAARSQLVHFSQTKRKRSKIHLWELAKTPRRPGWYQKVMDNMRDVAGYQAMGYSLAFLWEKSCAKGEPLLLLAAMDTQLGELLNYGLTTFRKLDLGQDSFISLCATIGRDENILLRIATCFSYVLPKHLDRLVAGSRLLAIKHPQVTAEVARFLEMLRLRHARELPAELSAEQRCLLAQICEPVPVGGALVGSDGAAVDVLHQSE